MIMVLDGTAYVTIEQAAETLATTIPGVLMLLKRKALHGIELDGRWLVSSGSVDCFKAHGKDMRQDLGCRSICTSGGCGCR